MNSNSNSSPNNPKQRDFADVIWEAGESLVKLAWLILTEIYRHMRVGTFPFIKMGIALFAAYYVLQTQYEWYLFKYFEIQRWYPRNAFLYMLYYYTWVLSPIWIWGIVAVVKRRKFTNRIEEISHSIGLKNGLGKTPVPVFDKPNRDGVTRTLRLSRVGVSAQEFYKSKQALEGALNAYVDEINEDRGIGTIDIVYSKDPLTEHFELPGVRGMPTELGFVVGTTRAKIMTGSFKETPHLLIAGQTGGGKSTFLRQLITCLYLDSNDLEMTLIDLKGGLEFQLFENLPRVQVIPDLRHAVKNLKVLEDKLAKRMHVLRQSSITSIDQASSDKVRSAIGKSRHLIIVDEAAEIFLGGHDLDSGELAETRRILSQIARQGRATGMHLVLATQRPDARALDTQVKANLTGILCFQMPNNTSSITVLDSGRASQLPDIPGRALWKQGPTLTELQTPFLSIERANEELKSYRVTPNKSTASVTAKAPSSLEIES